VRGEKIFDCLSSETDLEHGVPKRNLPSGFGGNQRLRDQTAEENQHSVQYFAAQQIDCDGDENRVSSHRRREPFVHS
jgi:hypothetical protein